MKLLGDRRIRVRFEVVGTLRGSLKLTEPAHVVNISVGGALLQTSSAVTVGSVQTMYLNIDGHTARVTGRVRRSARIDENRERGFYELGVEFLPVSAALAQSLTQLIAIAQCR